MSAPAGFIELERTVASIQVGRRHRSELGDIDALAASIDRDSLLQQPRSQLEAAALDRELKQVMAEDAARRQAATQFSAQQQPGDDGAGKLPTPSDQGRAGEQAARMIPGAASYKTLDKISYLQQIAEDPAQADELRQQTTAALERIDAGSPVDPLYRQIREQADTAHGEDDADLHQLATDALARIKATTP